MADNACACYCYCYHCCCPARCQCAALEERCEWTGWQQNKRKSCCKKAGHPHASRRLENPSHSNTY